MTERSQSLWKEKNDHYLYNEGLYTLLNLTTFFLSVIILIEFEFPNPYKYDLQIDEMDVILFFILVMLTARGQKKKVGEGPFFNFLKILFTWCYCNIFRNLAWPKGCGSVVK